ncbi:hypothetical protein COOONC_15973 [Cooperia oncophora]
MDSVAILARKRLGPILLRRVKMAGSTSTMEATQRKVKTAVDGMIDELDRSYLRDMQKQMFLCSAKGNQSRCCEHKDSTREIVEKPA